MYVFFLCIALRLRKKKKIERVSPWCSASVFIALIKYFQVQRQQLKTSTCTKTKWENQTEAHLTNACVASISNDKSLGVTRNLFGSHSNCLLQFVFFFFFVFVFVQNFWCRYCCCILRATTSKTNGCNKNGRKKTKLEEEKRKEATEVKIELI